MKFTSFILSLTATATHAFVPSASFARTSSQLDASIQFIKGIDEKDIPNVKLTRARDGSSGVATFQFSNPNCFDASIQGEVTGMFMVDEEGEMSTNEVNARFSNGKPQSIESTYVMKSPLEWDRFMRFMERYGEENGLGLTKK
mmetsp:Transcript_14576/g.22198  ORF Transcript_14576/g.22198 Transcript_14576/m.22198 type:complete len:143 (-) Transcript_14576:860-1288(-)|eukprot:CAMPEP_0118720290 /NCGR_PEP_ID=MMETSP0800-20121206/30021_1 /TAXON_ID=210618 ORGANISM="Striatella unipunctata, Strain CCMP2910" /NCGR_SAMPLE_ID=MMETSP0800 /ASSEMBLY_ACC=CAM_ASM_000638 /LENGTH=142 /DNA_ID=CAMNT_0006627899 /DNA_START=6 /DNA_END=434 /DNA_ORIENTATION=+